MADAEATLRGGSGVGVAVGVRDIVGMAEIVNAGLTTMRVFIFLRVVISKLGSIGAIASLVAELIVEVRELCTIVNAIHAKTTTQVDASKNKISRCFILMI